MRFFIVPSEIFNYGLKPNEIAVFAYLCSCADNKTFECFPSAQKIAKACGVGESTVRAITHKLEKKGLIKIKPRYNLIPDSGKRRQTSNLYYVSLLKECRQEEREIKQLYKSLGVTPRDADGVPLKNRGQLTKHNITTNRIKNKSFISKKFCSDASVFDEPDFKAIKDMCIKEVRNHYDKELACCSFYVDNALDLLWNERLYYTDMDFISARNIVIEELTPMMVINTLKQFEIGGTYDVNVITLCDALCKALDVD